MNTAHLRVDLGLLREFLRLPRDVRITAVRPAPDRADQCLIELSGNLPAEGELSVNYDYHNTTAVVFKGFVKP